MCALFYENRLGIKKIVISFVYVFCPNTGTKFREPYHSNHVIPTVLLMNGLFKCHPGDQGASVGGENNIFLI